MKKSKSSSSSKGKRKHSPVEEKRKHAKSLPNIIDKQQNKKDNEDKFPRKTRWEASKANSKDETDKQASSRTEETSNPEPPRRIKDMLGDKMKVIEYLFHTASSRTEETSNPEPPRRIKDMLGDKMKVIEYLFHTVTVTALQDLIPDYLKNHSIEELKKMCFDEIKLMDDEIILKIASGECTSLSDEPKSSTMKVDNKPTSSISMETKEEDIKHSLTPERQPSPVTSEAFTNDLLELCATSDEMKDLADNEYEVGMDEEVIQELGVIDNDTSLIELEMRARAIRSLLKAKGKSLSDSEE